MKIWLLEKVLENLYIADDMQKMYDKEVRAGEDVSWYWGTQHGRFVKIICNSVDEELAKKWT